MIALLLALAAGAAQDSSPAADTLRYAEIRIILEHSYAVVVAAYDVERDGDSLVFHSARLPGQVLLIDGAFGPDYSLDQVQRIEERLLVAPAGEDVVTHYHMRYTVEGEYRRVPLFIPNAAVDPAGDLSVTVVGASDRALRHAGLDFEIQPDGSRMARVAALPDVVALGSDRSLGLKPWLLWAGLLLAAALLGYALTRAVRARRASRADRNPPPS